VILGVLCVSVIEKIKHMKTLKGIFPPIPTPFLNDELALDKLAVNISIWNTTGLKGYVILGSNGEAVFLTRDEKVKITATVKELASSDKLLIAGTGTDSIRETISLTNEIAEYGADYALILTPSFYTSEMKHDAFISYFTKIADAVKIPVIIYNVPKFTGVDIQAETIAQLAEHPNIAGIKNSTENLRQIVEFVAAVPDTFAVLVGTASVLYNGLTSGAMGGILALANIAPEECVHIKKLILAGKLPESLTLQKRMIPVNKAVTTQYGVAGLKAAMDMLGYFGGEPRAPLMPLGNKEREEIHTLLINAELLL
jgi:4-hydroxy-2-oxoglutarate aldolase